MKISEARKHLRADHTPRELRQMSPERTAGYARSIGTTPATVNAALRQLQTELETQTSDAGSNRLQGRSASAERIKQKDLWDSGPVTPAFALDLESAAEIQQNNGEKLSPSLRKMIDGLETERARDARVSQVARAMGSSARELIGVFDSISYGRPPPKEAIIEIAREAVKSTDRDIQERRDFLATQFVADVTGLRKIGKDQWVATVALLWSYDEGRDEKRFVDVPIGPKGDIIGDPKRSSERQPLTRAMVRALITYNDMGYERPVDEVVRAAFRDNARGWKEYRGQYSEGEAVLQAMRPGGDGRFLVKLGLSWRPRADQLMQHATGWAAVNEKGKVVRQ